MKNTWVLSIKTSLPKVCWNAGDLKTNIFAFDSFEEARTALRKALKKYAYAQNTMFDGNGNMIYFQKYIDGAYEPEDDEEFGDAFLTKAKLMDIYKTLQNIFDGEDIHPDFSEECDDGMIACIYKNKELEIYGVDDGPCNGYNPVLKTNMFSMKDEKNYFFYIDDAFGQDEATSELYIDLVKAEKY